jgi:hypothetical protein
VLWLDAESFELRFLDFGYTAPDSLANPAFGGRVDFARLRDGQWIVRRWILRVPGAVVAPRGRVIPAVREEIQEVSRSSLEALGIAQPVKVATAISPDSLARLACAGATTDSTGIVAGVARDGATGVPVAGAEVQAEWLGFIPSGSSVARAEPQSRMLRSDRDGRFELCAAPSGALVTLTAHAGDRVRSLPTIVRATRQAVALTELQLLVR